MFQCGSEAEGVEFLMHAMCLHQLLFLRTATGNICLKNSAAFIQFQQKNKDFSPGPFVEFTGELFYPLQWSQPCQITQANHQKNDLTTFLTHKEIWGR